MFSNLLTIPRISGLILVCGLAGCVYFNTYYNAQAAYDAARDDHVELFERNPDTVLLALPGPIEQNYDSAIAKSTKILDIFPRQKKWHDNALFLIARSLFYKGDYSAAIARIAQLQSMFPESPSIPESYVYLGEAHLRLGNLDKAEKAFQTVLTRYPNYVGQTEIALLLSEMNVERGSRSIAIGLLEDLLKKPLSDERKIEILLEIAGLYADIQQYAKALGYLELAPRKRKNSDLLYQVDLLKSECLIAVDSLTQAHATLEKMSRNGFYAGHMAIIQYRLGVVLNKLGRIDDAIDMLKKTALAFETAPEIGDVFFELAEIFQSARGDFEQAREYYDKAAQRLQDQKKREIAEKRRDAIDSIAALADSLEKKKRENDSIDTWGRNLFRVAEAYWLGLEQPDSALAWYNRVLSDPTVDQDSFPKAVFATGWILQATGDSTRADSLFEKLIVQYPSSQYAKAAQKAMDKPVTVVTRDDSAAIAFAEAEDLFLSDSVTLALERYDSVFARFPELLPGRRALFASAWINDHVLEKNQTAYKLYETICDSMPDSDFCKKAAEPRLRIVKDTLDALKKKKQ